jgi:signal transduction histidine kinase
MTERERVSGRRQRRVAPETSPEHPEVGGAGAGEPADVEYDLPLAHTGEVGRRPPVRTEGSVVRAGDGPTIDRPDRLHEDTDALRAALLAAEARFRSTVERSVDGVIVLDASGRVCFANAAAERLFGLDGSQLIGADFGFPAVAGEATEIDVLQAGREPVVADMRVAETTWDGERALLVLIRDVTDRRAAEERERQLIREQAARVEAEAHARRAEMLDRASRALGSTLDLDELLRRIAAVIVEELADVCLIDVDDRNGAMRRIAAARRDFPHRALLKGLEERPVQVGLHTAEARVLYTGASELVAEVTEAWLDRAAQNDDPAGAFSALHLCSLMMVTLYAGEVRWGVVSVLSCDPSRLYCEADVHLAEELVRRAGITLENARLYRLAQEASRAKSDFLAIVSHELRTPLSAVIGYAGLLEEGIAGELNDKQLEYLTSVRRSAEHLIRLIEQVITFARLEGDHERLQTGPVEVSRLVSDIGTLTRPLADRKGLRLILTIPSDGPVVEHDEKKIAQILINLVTNAVKYTDEGDVRLEAEVTDSELVLRVRDTGPGIPADKLGEIFEPFRQLEDPRTRREGGTGIGLSIVKNLTRLMGGEVGVSSRPGAGSTFTVRLPLLPQGRPDSE